MADVIDRAEFLPFVARLEALERENRFLRSLLMRESWLTRAQTMKALNCSETTLHRLTKLGRLAWRKEGKYVSYELESVRAYLTAHNVESWAVDERVITALRT